LSSTERIDAMHLDKLFGVLSGLSGTYRFSNAKLSNPESVLEHTGAVVLMCYFLTNELCHLEPDIVDLSKVLSKAAVHDVEELLIGDVPRTTKHSSRTVRECFNRLEEWALDRIADELDIAAKKQLIDDHLNAKEGMCGLIVEIADILAVVYKVHEEAVERGNISMLSRVTSCRDQLKKVTRKVEKQKWSEKTKAFLLGLLEEADTIIDDTTPPLTGRVAGMMAISEGR
jgi:5'-deoxynucleotidase YfbR-like HD superfamily hydrolase